MHETENKDMDALSRDALMDTLDDDAYLMTCRCPACGATIRRTSAEAWKFCTECGQRVHMRAFTEEELAAARFERECDEYCT